MNQDKRLDKVEGSLTPKQAALLWMEDAHTFPDVVSYVTSFRGQPDTAHPLWRLSVQVDRATREGMKGARKEAVEAAVHRAVRDVAFLFHLHNQVNFDMAKRHDAWEWRLIALAEGLKRMWGEEAFSYLLRRGKRASRGSKLRQERSDKDRQDWKLLASAFAVEMYEFQAAAETISRNYFDGQEVLFADSVSDVAGLVKDLEELVEHFNGDLMTKGKRSARIDLDDFHRRIGKRATALAGAFVDFAKSDALINLGERRAGLELMERHLG